MAVRRVGGRCEMAASLGVSQNNESLNSLERDTRWLCLLLKYLLSRSACLGYVFLSCTSFKFFPSLGLHCERNISDHVNENRCLHRYNEITFLNNTDTVAFLHGVFTALFNLFHFISLFPKTCCSCFLRYHWLIQSVPGGLCQTSGGCSLC
jgi:hypothetical protein